MKLNRRNVVAGIAASTAASSIPFRAAFAQSTDIVVYSSAETDQLAPYKAAFEAENPGINVVWVRDSSGVMAAKILAERDNPRADVIFDIPLSSIAMFDSLGMVTPYTPSTASNLKPRFRDDNDPMHWTGISVFTTVVVANQPEMAAAGVTAPTSWADLLKPEYKGRIVMPNPASSATGFITVAAWLNLFGEQGAWDYMDALHENIQVYLHSGSQPVARTGQGEYMIGIGSELRAAREKTQGAPIDIIVPSEGTVWDMGATCLTTKADKHDAAKVFVDWSCTRSAHEVAAQFFGIVGFEGLEASPENYPTEAEGLLLDLDSEAMGRDRADILAAWSERFDGKSAPRK